jgi:hypothetical protein
LTVALLLGVSQADLLISSQEYSPLILQDATVTVSDPTTTSSSTSSSSSNNSTFNAKVQDVTTDLKRINCILYDDLTVFDITSLEDTTGQGYYAPLAYTVSFCRPITPAGVSGYVFDGSYVIADASARPQNV